jgi:hypothetical protein
MNADQKNKPGKIESNPIRGIPLNPCRPSTIILIFMLVAGGWAQDAVDENALFSDTSSILDSTKVVQAAGQAPAETKTVGFSGAITSAGQATATYDLFDTLSWDHTRWSNYIVANLMLDARLPLGFKAFANAEIKYNPSPASGTDALALAQGGGLAADTGHASFSLRELFVDANIRNRAYFRTGKQVLQWGTCFFFNPTDLINVEKKSFMEKIGSREGAYGLKMHIPFGTRYNIYGFIDTKDADRPDQAAAALKLEALVGGTELAASIWDRRGAKPVYGVDFSTGLFDINFAGEAAVSYGDNNYRMMEDNGELSLEKTEKKLLPRASLGFTKMLTVNGMPNRMTVVGEFYYNGAGYTENIMKDSAFYLYREPLRVTGPNGQNISIPGGPKSAYFLANNLYEMNNYSRFYAALFTSFGRFINSNLTLSGNAIANLDQGSVMLNGALTFAGLNNFNLGLAVTGWVGPDKTEYTVWNSALATQLTAAVVF